MAPGAGGGDAARMEPETTEAAAAQAPVRPLRRRTDLKMIGGVAAGLGDYFAIDRAWVRLGFVLSAFLGGAGLVAYIVLWIVMPAASDADPIPLDRHAHRLARSMRGTPAWVGVVLLVIGVLLVGDQIVGWNPGILWGLGLILLGVLLFRERDDAPEALEPPLQPEPASTVLLEPATRPPTAPSPQWAPPVPRRRRERSPLGWLVLGALLVIEGIVIALDMAGAFGLSLAQYLAIPIAGIGIGLLVGAWYGRARWLTLLGILLVPFVLAASLIEVPFEGGFADLFIRPTSAAAVQPEYRLVGGELILDLRRVTPAAEPISIEASVVMGELLVLVDPGTPLEVTARVGAGDLTVLDQTFAGVRVEATRTIGRPTEGNAVLRLDLETSIGAVLVEEVPE